MGWTVKINLSPYSHSAKIVKKIEPLLKYGEMNESDVRLHCSLL